MFQKYLWNWVKTASKIPNGSKKYTILPPPIYLLGTFYPTNMAQCGIHCVFVTLCICNKISFFLSYTNFFKIAFPCKLQFWVLYYIRVVHFKIHKFFPNLFSCPFLLLEKKQKSVTIIWKNFVNPKTNGSTNIYSDK